MKMDKNYFDLKLAKILLIISRYYSKEIGEDACDYDITEIMHCIALDSAKQQVDKSELAIRKIQNNGGKIDYIDCALIDAVYAIRGSKIENFPEAEEEIVQKLKEEKIDVSKFNAL
jgi:hypothetical protein